MGRPTLIVNHPLPRPLTHVNVHLHAFFIPHSELIIHPLILLSKRSFKSSMLKRIVFIQDPRQMFFNETFSSFQLLFIDWINLKIIQYV